MTRLRRVLQATLTTLSLLLFVAGVAVWVKSYWRTHGWCYHSVTVTPSAATLSQRCLAFEAGRVHLADWRNQTTQPAQIALARDDPGALNFGPPQGFVYISYPEETPLMPWRPLIRFDFRSNAFPRPGGWTLSIRIVTFPIWIPMLVLATPPLIRLRRRRRRRRLIASNRCPACGYDLRATPDRCPECGAEPPSMAHP